MDRLQRLRFGTAALSACLLTPVVAPEVAWGDAPTDVSEVVITTTRLPAPLDVTPGAYVITDKDIEQRQATFAADILTTVPSLSVYSAGAFGGTTGVRQRGASSDKSLVLIDGVELNDASQPAGGFDFSAIDLADVSRVEVLNGPQSSIWGSDAIGGVIAFTTREANGVRLNLEGGSYGTGLISGSAGRSTDRWAIGVAASSFSTTGISEADPRNNYSPYPGLAANEPDGTREITASVRGRFTFSPRVELDGQVRINQSRTDVDGYPPPYYFVLADTNDVATSRSLDAYVHAKVDGPFDLRNDFSVDRYVIARGDSGDSGDYGYNAARNIYRWTMAHGGVTDEVSFLVGAERQDARASLSDGGEHNLGATSVFGVAQWRPIRSLTTSASLRYDDPDIYRGQVTARLGAGYGLGDGFSLAASWGQGFKTPTISETACDFCYTPPVASLQPEHADGEDIGLVWRSADNRFSARTTVFVLNVRDEIDYLNGHYINIARTRSRGVEVEADAVLGAGFSLQAAYTHDDAFDLDPTTRAPRVPADMFSGALFWNHGPIGLGLALRSESDQPDVSFDSNPIERPGFAVANLTGSYALNDHVTLTARIENLADTRYQETSGFAEPGRSVYVGVRLRD
jgi:vitamin B12 transporter